MKHVTDLSEQPCNKSDKFDKVVTSCQQVVPNLLATDDKHAVRIHLVDGLLADPSISNLVLPSSQFFYVRYDSVIIVRHSSNIHGVVRL